MSPCREERGRHARRWTARSGLVAAALFALAGGGFAQDDLGKLFFTPERRAALDSQRQLDMRQARVIEGEKLSVDGVVRRSSGKSTVWINGVAHHDRIPASEVHPRISSTDPSRVELKADDDPPASLRVGQSINRTTRELTDGLHGGKVSTRPVAP